MNSVCVALAPICCDRARGGKRQRNGTDELDHGGERNVREIGSLGDADQRVVVLHGALGGGDIGTPFEQRRGKRDRNVWNSAAQQARADRQLGRRPADQDRDGVLELRPLHADAQFLGFDGQDLRLGQRHVGAGRSGRGGWTIAGVKFVQRDLVGFAELRRGAVQEIAQ